MSKSTPGYQNLQTISDLLINNVEKIASDVKLKNRLLDLDEVRSLQVSSKAIVEISIFVDEKTKVSLKQKTLAELKEILRNHPALKGKTVDD